MTLKRIEDIDFENMTVTGSLYEDRPLRCYYCNAEVTPEENAQVWGLIDFLMAENDPMNEMFVDAFVHMSGALPYNLDDEGNVVICSKDTVRELYEAKQASD